MHLHVRRLRLDGDRLQRLRLRVDQMVEFLQTETFARTLEFRLQLHQSFIGTGTANERE